MVVMASRMRDIMVVGKAGDAEGAGEGDEDTGNCDFQFALKAGIRRNLDWVHSILCVLQALSA